ncbi:MAG: protein kinase [Chloroflexi bacterium]|nr:protein kinase [Chloroflexota bacterium]
MTTLITNRYQIENEIGSGGMGTVYCGLDTRTHEQVAIKHLKPEIARADLIERFKREGAALRDLNHPNIVKMLDAVEEHGNHYLVLEYLPGGDLGVLLDHESLPVERVVKLAIEIADALTRAHHLNIIHRDLKPGNVLLAEDGTPRLTDFGIAHIAQKERITETNALVGTVDYLAPEVLGGGTVGPQADIWAFGVMLFEMLSGERPFEGETLTATITRILTASVPDLESLRPDVPIALVDLVYRMLEKNPQARIPSVRIVGAELESILLGRTSDSGATFIQPQSNHLKRFATDLTAVAPPTKHNLPAQVTPFIGRESELEALDNFLLDPNIRLITILGMGGIGKTRLALETARHFTGQNGTRHNKFTNGVYFVPLAPITAAELVVTTIADSLQFSFYSADMPDQQLLDYLREKSMLLVLDNFEHVIDAATLVADILQTAPDIKIIVTSRERLNLRGETIFTIGGMEFPEWETPENVMDYSGVKLFLQSAHRIQPDFELAQDDVPYLARICRLVMGMPLGIELAAGWVDTLRLDEIAAEIQQNVDFLETEMRDAPERHRSIRAVFEYSWALLNENERDLLSKLSVFRGGFTRDAAIAVTGTSLRTLTSLVNKSLLSRDMTGRYQIHELIRQYADESLQASGQREDVYAAHAGYYADFFGKLFVDFTSMADQEAIRLIETDMDNLRATWRWAVAHRDISLLNKLMVALHSVGQVRSLFREGLEASEAALQAVDTGEPTEEEASLIIELLMAVGWLSIRLGDIAKAKTALERGTDLMRIAQPPVGHEDPMTPLSLTYSLMGDYETAIRIASDALHFHQSRGDEMSAIVSYYVLTSAAFGKGDYQAAKHYSEQALSLARKVEQIWFEAYIRIDLGHIARVMGDYAEARHHYQTSYSIRKEIFKDPEGTAVSLKHLGRVALLEGDAAQAKSQFEESIAIYKDLGDRGGLATALTGLGLTMTALGDYRAARENHRRALELVVAMHLTPLILSTLVGFGDLFLHSNQTERGHELLGLIFHHPLSNQETKDEVKTLLEQHGDSKNPAFARGKNLVLETIVNDLLVEESHG